MVTSLYEAIKQVQNQSRESKWEKTNNRNNYQEQGT